MPDVQTFALFLAAALVVAITPGPGIFYIVARTLAGGRAEGLASSVGLGLGGLVHVFAGAAGMSALIMASSEAFTLLKIAGALYLVWLGLKTWREARIVEPAEIVTTGGRRAFREGIVVEALNPKTAAFFLAFIPQFVDPKGAYVWQVVLLGATFMAIATVFDSGYALLAGRAGRLLTRARVRLVSRISGALLVGGGVWLALARR